MRVKVFQGRGYDDIKNLEARMNGWLEASEKEGWCVTKTDTGILTIGASEDGPEQQVVIVIWYDRAR